MATLLVVLSVSACGASDRQFDKVVMLSVDTLRADYIGAYGAPAWITPHLDRFAAESVVFENAITSATSTLPSHTSLLYSVHTFVHRAYTQNPPLTPGLVSPIETLQSVGFRTGGYVGGGQLRPAFGLDRGFETYEVVNTRDINDETRGTDRLAALLEAGTRFLRRHRDESFFLFLHTYEPHFPYDAPQRFVEQVGAHDESVGGGIDLQAPLVDFEVGLGVPEEAWIANERRSLYAAEVLYVDDFFGRLMRRIDNLGLADEVVVVVLSDHGESLGERGLLGHNNFTEEQLKVPLMIRVPGAPPRRDASPVHLLDVMPTLYSLLGQAQPYPFMGLDLATFVTGGEGGPDAERLRFSENKGRAAVVSGTWKVVFDIEDPMSFELYDLATDPGELTDRADERPALAVELISEYERLTASNADLPALFPRAGDSDTALLDPETIRELRALGYIQ